ncbi:hypothetical protein GE21DRAFT_6844 [Neurospora crassa]|nr:hypothetical protein GE21DRAFT_6844 [Neurospora crassa]
MCCPPGSRHPFRSDTPATPARSATIPTSPWSRWLASGSCLDLISSIGGRTISDKFSSNIRRFPEARENIMCRYVALAPAPPHPITGKVLSFIDGKEMEKGSYVDLFHDYECPAECLDQYLGGGGCLTADCMNELDEAYDGWIIRNPWYYRAAQGGMRIIRWLPKRENILEDSPGKIPSGLDSDAFGHPVLIVTRGMDEKGRMTSFNNRNILAKFPLPSHRRNREPYWPIDPTPKHPDTGNLLKLKDKRRMDKEYSYVNSQTSYPVCYGILEPYKSEDPEDVWVVEEESYEKLTKGRDYDRFHSSSWRKSGEKPTLPLPEPVKEREQEGKQASKATSNDETPDLAEEIREKYIREYFEEVNDFLLGSILGAILF